MFRGRNRNNRGGAGSYRGGRGDRGRGGKSSNNQPARLRGLFADGIWQCNCIPRLPAEHFKVKKEGPNKDRWFYTCQNAQDKRCDFFLWDEVAKPREEAAVLSNSRSEPGARGAMESTGAQEGWNAGRGRGMFANVDSSGREVWQRQRADSQATLSPSPPPPYSSPAQPQANGSKRTAQDAGFESDDDPFDWPLTGQEADALEQTAAKAVPQTPLKVQKMGVYDTPTATTEKQKRKLPWLEEPAQEPATPVSAAKPSSDYFDTPSKVPMTADTVTPSANAPITPIAPPTVLATAKSPSPLSRYKDALHNPADSASTLTFEALDVLADTAMLPATRDKLRSILSKHDLKTQGITKGRDISRLALKAKDAKIVELQAKIASLEAEREVDRGVRRMGRWDREHGRGKNDG